MIHRVRTLPVPVYSAFSALALNCLQYAPAIGHWSSNAMKTRAIAVAQDRVEPGFGPVSRASRSATVAVLLALVFGLTSLAGTAVSLAF